MKKTTLKTRLWALAATLLLLVSLLAMPVSAANTPVAGGTFDFNKYLVMNANANVPNVEFEFEIRAGTAVPATEGRPAIYAGIVSETKPIIGVDNAGTVTAGNAVFMPADNTTPGTPTGADSTKKYATKTMTVDFNGISFSAPGIYRYIITEKTDETQQGISYDEINTRTLDVFVEYVDPDNGGALKVTSYVLYPDTKTDASVVAEESKDDGFTNTYTTYDLTLEKNVTGNQGDRDKYFAFSVKITGAVEGTVYTVDLSDAESTPKVDGTTQTNEATLIATSGSVNATYYLKHGQSIKIQGLTSNTAYTITETDYSTDGYTTTYAIDGGEPVTAIATPSENNTMNGAHHTVTFTNTKNGTVPTGILLETAPYLILGAVVVVGLVVLFATRRRRTRE